MTRAEIKKCVDRKLCVKRLYHRTDLSILEIADELSLSYSTVCKMIEDDDPCPVKQVCADGPAGIKEKDRKGSQMAFTKAQIAENIYEETGFTLNKSLHTVECLLEIIKGTLENGDDVLISGFGKFSVKQKRQRRGRNPATGESLMLAPRKVVTFKCSGKLREKVNGEK